MFWGDCRGGPGVPGLQALLLLDEAGSLLRHEDKGEHPLRRRRLDGSSQRRNIVSDESIFLLGDATSDKYPDELRRIVVRDKEKNEKIVFLTNHFGFGATTIAAIYKDRWEIELFFKALKQNLKVKTFIGTSENALRIQIWTALAPLGGLLFDVPDGTSNSPCLHARDQVASSSVTGSVVLLEHGDDAAAEPLHLPGFASLAGRTVRNAAGDSEAGTA